MSDAAKQRLLELVKERSVIHKAVTLASGKSSSFYIDGKMVLMASESAALIGELLYTMTRDLRLDAIGGPEVGAIPMATAAVVRYHQAGKPMEGFFVRKEAKQHGTQKQIEGKLLPGNRVAVVEDVMTTGGSVAQAIEAVRRAGATVEVVIALVDRQQGARERIEAMGCRFESVWTLRDLGLAAV
jgi:orotate phosphoribosyltransferase